MTDETGEKESVSKALSVTRGREIGQPQLVKSGTFAKQSSKRELEVPYFYNTVRQMKEDPAVAQPLEVNRSFRTNSTVLGGFEGTGSNTSKSIAEYANYVIHNMTKQTWFEAVQNMNTDIEYGFSLGELNTVRATSGPFKGNLILSHVGARRPESVHAWVWDKYEREVTHVVQNPLELSQYKLKDPSKRYLGSMAGLQHYHDMSDWNKYPLIPMNKLLHVKYNPTFNNPQGNSPILTAFAPWQEKKIISEYQVIGITRDFGGIPICRVPSELLERANDPDNRYPQDKEALLALEQDLANTHAGKNSFFMLSSDLVDGSTSQFEYDIKLLGIEGSGKQFDISEIVKQKNTEIYNAFNMGHLILGQNGNTSSYNLSTSGQTISSVILHRDLSNTAAQIESIISRLLDAQRIEYDRRDLPKFRWKEVDEITLDELGKFIQRTKSVGGLPEDVTEELYKRAGYPSEGVKDLDFTDKGESRAGESKGSSGTGSSQGSAGSNSATNVENKSMAKHLVADDYGDGSTAYTDRDTGELVLITEN